MVTRHNCKRDCIADFCRQVTLAKKWSVYFMLGSSETSIRYACFKKYCTIPNMYEAVVCRLTFPSESYLQDAITTAERSQGISISLQIKCRRETGCLNWFILGYKYSRQSSKFCVI